MTLTVGAPVPGRAVALTAVPDPVFAEAMVGPGVAVEPPGRVVDAVAPVSGTLATVRPHAFVVTTDDGTAVLVHLGIDTVALDGRHFTVHGAAGDRVRAGEVVTTWDVAAVAAEGLAVVVPVVVLDRSAADVRVTVVPGADVGAGEVLLSVR